MTFTTGTNSGWHHHPGVILVLVKSGTVTVHDENCQTTAYTAGQGYLLGRPSPDIDALELLLRDWRQRRALADPESRMPVRRSVLAKRPASLHDAVGGRHDGCLSIASNRPEARSESKTIHRSARRRRR